MQKNNKKDSFLSLVLLIAPSSCKQAFLPPCFIKINTENRINLREKMSYTMITKIIYANIRT